MFTFDLMKIRKAKRQDIDTLLTITLACGKRLMTQHIYQRNEEYPSRKAFTTDLEREELYVLLSNDAIIGCITISTFMDAEYQTVDWLTPNENNIYIHRLAVHPEFQGQGYAQFLMNYAENYAREHQYQSVRLDTFSQNPRNLKFYEQRGYQTTGEIYFSRIKDYSFYCYELLL